MTGEMLHPSLFDGHADILNTIHPQDVTTSWEVTPAHAAILALASTADAGLFYRAHQPDFFAYPILDELSAANAVGRQVKLAARFMEEERQSLVVPVLFGTARAADKLIEYCHGNPAMTQRIQPMMIQRSVGTTLVQPRVFSGVTHEALGRAGIKAIFEDMLDIGNTVAIGSAYLESADGTREGLSSTDRHLLETLANVGTDRHINLISLYEDIARNFFQEHKTVLIYPFSKNRHFYDALKTVADTDRTIWGKWQRKALSLVEHFNPQDWIMGEGIDTGVKGLLLKEKMLASDQSLADDQVAAPILEQLSGQIIRIGATGRGIIALKPGRPEEQFANLTDWYADQWATQLKAMSRKQP